MKHLGHTRSALRSDHLLHTPDTFVRAPLPGMLRSTAIVHCGPAVGAGFTQYTAEMERDGRLGGTQGQRFVYVLSGAIVVEASEGENKLAPGGFAYLPQSAKHGIIASAESRLAVIEKPYIPAEGVAQPPFIVGSENKISATALLGDESLQVRSLLPAGLEFDFAVNTMSYDPGASLSMVEVHVMEHGLLMLCGEGIYRLGDNWYPVVAGDFIWMRAFCPQWFAALGKVQAKYLIYKDWNRSPLSSR